MSRDAVLNRHRHRLLRRTVPLGENFATALLVAVLVAVVGWVAAQRDRVDPGRRDLPPELLEIERPEIELYVPPLKHWREPGQTGAAPAAPAIDPFPAALLEGGWIPAGRVRSFDAGNLYEKINGEAEKFLKQGFVSMHYLVLATGPGGDEIAIELYDQGGVAGSTGVFAAHRTGGRVLSEREGVTYFRTPIGVIGRVGRHFFRAAGNRESEAIDAKAEQMVTTFAALDATANEQSADPPGLAVLRRLGIEESRVEFKRENAFQLDFARGFWFGELVADEGAVVFVHFAPSPDDAGALLGLLLEEQGFEHEPVAGTRPWALLRHRVLGTHFAVARRGGVLYGIDRLNDPDRARSIMERLEGSLDGG